MVNGLNLALVLRYALDHTVEHAGEGSSEVSDDVFYLRVGDDGQGPRQIDDRPRHLKIVLDDAGVVRGWVAIQEAVPLRDNGLGGVDEQDDLAGAAVEIREERDE